MLGKLVDEGREPGLVFQQRGDVVEENSLLRKIRDFANKLLQLVGGWTSFEFHVSSGRVPVSGFRLQTLELLRVRTGNLKPETSNCHHAPSIPNELSPETGGASDTSTA